MITPALSVLSAVEGLGIASAVVDALRGADRGCHSDFLGTESGQPCGRCSVWTRHGCLVRDLGHRGTCSPRALHYPRVMLALSPNYALAYAGHVRVCTTFAVLGAVFLALTGGEALYADMGHFGRPADPYQLVRVRAARFGSGLPRSRSPCAGRPASADNPSSVCFRARC
jgi:KUP system potassium uptake protein